MTRSEKRLTKAEYDALQTLRNRGFAVIIWNPDELQDVDPSYMEGLSVEKGWDIIETLCGAADEDILRP